MGFAKVTKALFYRISEYNQANRLAKLVVRDLTMYLLKSPYLILYSRSFRYAFQILAQSNHSKVERNHCLAILLMCLRYLPNSVFMQSGLLGGKCMYCPEKSFHSMCFSDSKNKFPNRIHIGYQPR